ENIKPIKIKPDILEAEAEAKLSYIETQKAVWISDNVDNYTYVGTETGTGTVNYIDIPAMEAAYSNHIELEWAADLNQDTLVDNVQKQHEKAFWQMFNSIQAKEWTPKGDPTVHRKGFVAEEMPDVMKGQDGQSIDPMSLISYMSKVEQALKEEIILQYEALNEFIKTGTITSQLEIEDRLEVLGGN
ncbi:MAG: hypothetical protein Q8P20_00985, partial [bacterium]|nr:hypothetical protein [bacterium]